MGKSVYNSVDELPDLSDEPVHTVDPQTKQVKTYKSIDDLPDLLKKKVSGESPSSATPSPSQSPQKENKTSSLSDFGILPSAVPKYQQANQPVSTDVVQPKITATYDDFRDHNAERKEKHGELVKQAITNTANKILKNKGVIKPEEEGKELNLSKYMQLANEKKKLQDAYDNGDATFAISKDGEVGLNRTTGWWESLSKGWNQAMKGNDEAAEFADMDAAQKVDFLKKKETEQPENKHPEYLGERGSALGSLGGWVGENGPFVIHAGEGALLGTALTMAAPITGGTSLAGLPAATAFIFTANDAKNQGIQSEVTRRFYKLKKDNPEANEVDLMKQAEQGALAGGLAGIATNAALMTSAKTPLSLESKNVVGKAIQKTLGSTAYAAGATAGIEGAKLAESNLEGIKTTSGEVAKQMGKTFSETATTLGILHVLTGAATGAFNLPKTVKSAMKYALTEDAKPQEVQSVLKANVEAGNITQDVADKVQGELDAYSKASGKVVEGLSPEAHASVAGLIEAKDKLIAEAKTKDDSAKPYYDEKIDGINQQIQKTINTGKPYAHEVDEMSGNKYTEPTTTEPVHPNEPTPQEQGNKEPIPESTQPVSAGTTEMGTSILEPEIKPNETTQAAEVPIEKTQASTSNEGTPKVIEPTTEAEGGGTEPPKVTEVPKEEPEGNKFREKGILSRLNTAENVPEVSKEGFQEKGLKYEPQTHQEAEQIGKAMVDQYGIDDAVTLAETNKFKGGVNSAIFAESLNRIFKEEQDAKTPEAKLEAAKRFAEVGIRYDEFGRGQGRDISQVGHFYKKSPLGIKMMEEARRREDFEKYSKNKDQSWKEFFNEMSKDPEFDKEFKGKVQEELKKERAEARAKRIKKVDDIFDSAIKKFGSGGATYSSFIPVTPKVAQIALEGMKKAYHAGEKVAKLVEDAIDYISKEVGSGWNKDAFRKEWNDRLGEHESVKDIPIEKREKMLERFRNKLKGLTEKEKDDVIRRSFKKLVENGALEYEDFKKIIADTLGYGEMTPEQAKKIIDLVGDINKVDDMATALRDNNRNEKSLNEYLAAKKQAEKSATELGKMVFNRPDIVKRLLSIMQLNTLGIPSLINNPLFNVFNQSTVRLPRSLIMTAIDFGINKVGKAFGKDIPMENNVFEAQKEFYKKLKLGSEQSIEQLFTGLTNKDYFQKEVYASQIHPFTSLKELWEFKEGKTKLTPAQVADKSLQATLGVPAEIIARVLNIGDKPQRFATEGGQAAVFAKNLGLQGIDYKLFMEFPKEEAYRKLKSDGLSDEAAMAKAEQIQQRIIKEGEESTFQEDNLLNDALTAAFKPFGKAGDIVKTLNLPFVKIPLNAFWSVYNLANPEVALLQSAIYGYKAFKTKSSADIQNAKKWAAHAVTGMALMAVTGALAKKGIINPGNADDTTKKEREGEQNYEQQNAVNMSKLIAYMQGKDPNEVKNGLMVDTKWLGNMGVLMGYQAHKLEKLTPEQKEKGLDMVEDLTANLKESALDFMDKGVFSNSGALFTAINKGGAFMDSYLLNLINMGGNILQPAAFAQISRAQLPYYSKVKADSFQEEIKNNFLTRSSTLRDLTNEYPPSKVGIWGDKLEKKDDALMRLFGISRSNDDNFAQPIYNDYKKTNNTKFFPPSVKPEVKENGQTVKLNIKEAAQLETLVGQARKQLVAPYINNMATFEGSDKKYKDLSNDEKIKNLQILYDVGYKSGEFQFMQLHPEYKPVEKSDEQTEKENEMEQNNKQLRASAKQKVQLSE